MKLKLGKKPITIDIAEDVPYSLERVGDYIEIDIKDVAEIVKLRAKGFTDL